MRTDVDVAVVGAGPVGLAAALATARTGRRVVLVTERLPALEEGWPPTVEAVPPAFAALLAELGVAAASPTVVRRRVVAWESREPSTFDAAPALHLERPALDRMLLAAVLAADVRVVTGRRVDLDGRGWSGDGWRAARLVDATGRRASTARVRHRPPSPWIARVFSFPRAWVHRHAPELALAACTDGYAYRLGSDRTVVLGLVGPRTPGRLEDVLRRLEDEGAGWLTDGLPAAAARACRARVASVQWSDDAAEAVARVGDAALARDALSSQGLATGVSEGLYAAAADSPAALELLRVRQREQRAIHLASLSDLAARCRFAHAPAWRDYRRWLERVRPSLPSGPAVALARGRISTLDPAVHRRASSDAVSGRVTTGALP